MHQAPYPVREAAAEGVTIMGRREMVALEKYLQMHPDLNPEDLESLADLLLADQLKNRSRTKTRVEEYPVLSDRQFQRRYSREIPFSALPKGFKVAFGLAVEDEERRQG